VGTREGEGEGGLFKKGGGLEGGVLKKGGDTKQPVPQEKVLCRKKKEAGDAARGERKTSRKRRKKNGWREESGVGEKKKRGPCFLFVRKKKKTVHTWVGEGRGLCERRTNGLKEKCFAG